MSAAPHRILSASCPFTAASIPPGAPGELVAAGACARPSAESFGNRRPQRVTIQFEAGGAARGGGVAGLGGGWNRYTSTRVSSPFLWGPTPEQIRLTRP